MLGKYAVPTNHDCRCGLYPGGRITEDPSDSPHLHPFVNAGIPNYDTLTQRYPLAVHIMALPIHMGIHVGTYNLDFHVV